MKRYTIYTFSALALLLAAAACTQDDAGTLPDGTQPLTLTAAIEGSADTRATVDNRWNGNETIALQVTDGDGTDWYDYMVDDKGNMSGPRHSRGKHDLEREERPEQRRGLSVGRLALQ